MSDSIMHIKCVLLGEMAVGKSSLISRFVSNTYKSDFASTLAAYCSKKQVNYEKYNKKINYEIWDTAGQEKFRSLTKIFYKDARVAILVYDITRKDTFEALKNYWYKEVRDNSPSNVIIVIVGNKSDLYEYEEINEEEAKEFAESVNAIYQQTSAAQNSGINELFNMVGLKILNPNDFQEFQKIKTFKLKQNQNVDTNISNKDEKSGNQNNNDNNNKNSKNNKSKQNKKNCC